MARTIKILSYFIVGLNAVLIFFWIFSSKLSIPVWLQPTGRMHPMLLHLPIGFFLFTLLTFLIRNQFKKKSFSKVYLFGLNLTAITAAIVAIMGLFLSREGGYSEVTLDQHLNLGTAFSLVAAILLFIPFDKGTLFYHKLFSTVGLILLLLTGHYGATLTHGEDYVLAPLRKSEMTIESNDSITVFAKAILPVLDKKCTTCHNPKKKKGELILMDEENILKGGENGVVLLAGDSKKSEMIKRIHLELEHDDHMPPSGKPQLTEAEIKLLEQWIDRGADFKSMWIAMPTTDSLKITAAQVLKLYEPQDQLHYSFQFVSSDKIQKLNTPSRSVAQVSLDEPALNASFYMANLFKFESVQELDAIHEQLIELNLSGMPIIDDNISTIAKFKNLETLNLNNTKITDAAIGKLTSLENLKQLSLSGTKVTAQILQLLSKMKNLQEVFIWNTTINQSDLKSISNNSIHWNLGFIPDEKEKLKLTPPILQNEQFLVGANDPILLKHNLPGTKIRYSLDGTNPDSVNGLDYSKPFNLNKHSTLKTIAYKNGWQKSNMLEYTFFTKGVVPIKSVLQSSPNKDYKAKGATSFTDNILGEADNFRDGNWLGFRESKLEATFTFEKSVHEITLVVNQNIGSYLMPPQEVQIWGIKNGKASLIKTTKPSQPKSYEPNKLLGITVNIDGDWNEIKIIGLPVPKLPSWHSGKGEKGWLMVSEVIFN